MEKSITYIVCAIVFAIAIFVCVWLFMRKSNNSSSASSFSTSSASSYATGGTSHFTTKHILHGGSFAETIRSYPFPYEVQLDSFTKIDEKTLIEKFNENKQCAVLSACYNEYSKALQMSRDDIEFDEELKELVILTRDKALEHIYSDEFASPSNTYIIPYLVLMIDSELQDGMYYINNIFAKIHILSADFVKSRNFNPHVYLHPQAADAVIEIKGEIGYRESGIYEHNSDDSDFDIPEEYQY